MRYLLALILLISTNAFAQKPCEYASNFTDSIGSYKSTKSYVVHERNFAGKSSYIFFSLVNADGTPVLKMQVIEKSADFIKAACLDASSKIYFQLASGKIVTLIHSEEESCGSMVPVSEENKYSRLLDGTFLFLKGTMEDLKNSPITLMRVKYATGMIDYVFKKELVSELTKETYQPEKYFMNYLSCVE